MKAVKFTRCISNWGDLTYKLLKCHTTELGVMDFTSKHHCRMNSSINISTDAGAQIASDLGKGVIQGVSQYISKRMRTVKITLKAGHRVLLHSPEK